MNIHMISIIIIIIIINFELFRLSLIHNNNMFHLLSLM